MVEHNDDNNLIDDIPFPEDKDPKGWWYLRYHVCVKNDKSGDKSGNDKMKDIIIQDYSSWTLFVSLLMSVDMSAILVFTPKDNFEAGSLEPLQYWFAILYVIFFSLAALLSTLAAYSGVKGYNYYNGMPAVLIFRAIEREKMTHPYDYAPAGLVLTFLGGLMGIFYTWGLLVGLVILVFFSFGYMEYINIDAKYTKSVSDVPYVNLYYNHNAEKGHPKTNGTRGTRFPVQKLIHYLCIIVVISIGLLLLKDGSDCETYIRNLFSYYLNYIKLFLHIIHN